MNNPRRATGGEVVAALQAGVEVAAAGHDAANRMRTAVFGCCQQINQLDDLMSVRHIAHIG